VKQVDSRASIDLVAEQKTSRGSNVVCLIPSKVNSQVSTLRTRLITKKRKLLGIEGNGLDVYSKRNKL
jgi:hypothetical protein